MKHFFFCAGLLISSTSLFAQVGIGTNTPKAFFNVAGGKDVLFGSDVSGAGFKLMWFANQAAFRVGYVTGSSWDLNQIGSLSFGSGFNAIASGYSSIAMGYIAQATGSYSVSMGRENQASGENALAMGFRAIASGNNSTAIGTIISTNDKSGSFIFGDNSSVSTLNSDNSNQMMMRFSNGYKLFTNASATIGVSVSPNGNAWTTLSDSTRKENFRAANGADFLQKIAKMRLGSWNYKGQDVETYRHYGPMAQDFFAAFGHDELGTIGEDKSINQADFDGVNLIAIQALIWKVEELETENRNLKQETASLHSAVEAIKRQLADDSKVTFKP